MSDKVQHVIKEGLVHGRYYRVYVTQVNTRGQESERSAPALIRVGDVTPPPVPILSLDTSEFENGCYASGSGNSINVMIQWTDVSTECDDLARYIRFVWYSIPNGWNGDRAYDKSIGATADITSLIDANNTKETLMGQPNGAYLYIGIQSVDLSGNYSDIYILRVLSEDTTTLFKPTNRCYAEPYGAWAIRVWTECPYLSNIRSVVFYRNGVVQLPPVTFHKGMIAEYVDTLDTMTGLTHFYTYTYITLDGRESPMSDPSNTVTAKAIDTKMLDSASWDALKEAWQSELRGEYKQAIKEAAAAQAKRNQELADRLRGVQEDFDGLYNNFTVLANQIRLQSARMDEQDNKIITMGTELRQDAEGIALSATRQMADTLTRDITAAYTALLKVQADRITATVADLNGYYSQLIQLSNAMQAKVSKDDVSAYVALAVQNGISTAEIVADRIVLKGQLLMQGDARLVGRLYSNDIALVDSASGQVIWGAGSGTIKPTITQVSRNNNEYYRIFPEQRTTYYEYGGSYSEYYPTKIMTFSYTAKPPVNFNGNSRVTVTMNIILALGWYHDYDGPGGYWNGTISSRLREKLSETKMGLSCSYADSSPFVSTGEHPWATPHDISGTTARDPRFPWPMHDNGTMQSHEVEAVILLPYTITWTGTLPINRQVNFYLWVLGSRFTNEYTTYWDTWDIKWEAI